MMRSMRVCSRKYIGHYPQRLKIDWETMMGLGKINGADVNEEVLDEHSRCQHFTECEWAGPPMLHGKGEPGDLLQHVSWIFA